MNNDIFVAFPNQKIRDAIVKMLNSGGFDVAGTFSSFDNLKRKLGYYNSGIIICSYRLSDYSVMEMLEDMPDSFGVVVIGNKDQLELCEDDRVFKLSVPLQRDDLICSISMLLNDAFENKVKYKPVRSEKEKKFINLAKEILIDRYGMTEEQAHRYMQKKSMDTGAKLLDIARVIIG